MGDGGKAEADSSAENLELADKAALDLDEPGRFTAAAAAAVIAPVVDAAWKPRATLDGAAARARRAPARLARRVRDARPQGLDRVRRQGAAAAGAGAQYFNGTDTRMFVPLLAGLLGDIETVVTSNDKEALLLENT
jgi:hypothetical protein